jgi:hypothetical protein
MLPHTPPTATHSAAASMPSLPLASLFYLSIQSYPTDSFLLTRTHAAPRFRSRRCHRPRSALPLRVICHGSHPPCLLSHAVDVAVFLVLYASPHPSFARPGPSRPITPLLHPSIPTRSITFPSVASSLSLHPRDLPTYLFTRPCTFTCLLLSTQ